MIEYKTVTSTFLLNLPQTTLLMKKNILLLLITLFTLLSCKKDQVDATDTKSFQSSINDMASSLSTIQQIKFNEALYILKTFGVDAEGDAAELKALGTLLDGKKVPEIFAMADAVAQKNGIDWKSTGPPSMGDMNIFGNTTATEVDHNDVKASSLSILTKVATSDSLIGDKSIQIVPRLVDATDTPIIFDGAALETTLEVSSGGVRLMTNKNLMQNNDFKGFNLKYSSLPAEKIAEDKIDITVSVKTTNKTYKMSKIGVYVNPKALSQPIKAEQNTDISESPENTESTELSTDGAPTQTPTQNTKDPKATVQKFLSNLNSQNLKGAYDTSANPAWGSYDNFSNQTSGFGAVKSVAVKNVSSKSNPDNTATVNATYDVTDKNGKTTPLSVTFGMKTVNGEWKISSYKIN